ncbi:DUF3052 family protein [Streptomyces sp. NPDC002701]|uniref:DUF3052 family protein n=1 Tax=Streptomyces sp. NPDC002701 TaxID=3364661 RepID=UPI0036BC55AE
MEKGASGLLLTPKREVEGYVDFSEIGEAATSAAGLSLAKAVNAGAGRNGSRRSMPKGAAKKP